LAGVLGRAQTVPQMINYQGRVTVAGAAVDGPADFKFALVDGDGTTATTTYWSNDGTSTIGNEPMAAVTLTVSKGLYAVLLGGVGMTPIPASVFSDHTNVRLRIWFSQTSGGPYQLLAPDQRIAAVGYAMVAAQAHRVEELVTPLGNMVWIRPGSFALGSPGDEQDRESDEGPQICVTLRQGFWLGIREVTQQEYLTLMGTNPSQFTDDLNRPVEKVRWHDAVAFCAALTTQERNAGRIPSHWAYRLPTEAEWEYAARAGRATRFSYGDDPNYTELGKCAWSSANSAGATHPVGQKHPNAWGLYDTHGNVAEWCADWYGTYAGGSAIDPTGPDSGSLRVIRGGHWDSTAADCRAANRVSLDPEATPPYVGFRVVLAASRP
jgi:formylglycine-generating enzyme required for sulfatase activity